jgi:DsbC/DsbD-like thiol-disulfide interchange protein
MRISRSLQALSVFASLGWLVTATPGNADVTEWASSEGGRMRVVTLDVDQQGMLEAGLEIELKPGWITYWREPGEAGIPPHIATSSADSGITVQSLVFPVPKLIMNGEMRDIGYDQSVLLPFKLGKFDPSKDNMVKLSAFIGVCQNICIPFQAEFEIKASKSSKATAGERQSLENAYNKLPQQPDDNFKVTSYAHKQDNTIAFDVLLPEGANDAIEVYLTGPDGYAFSSPTKLKQTGRHAVFDMDVSGLPKRFSMKGSHWRILIKAGDKAIESPLQF